MKRGSDRSDAPNPPRVVADTADNLDFRGTSREPALSHSRAGRNNRPLSNHSSPLHLSRFHRTLLAGAGLLLLAGFALAAFLEPAPAGYGTHRQLGLPPCSMRAVFGIPCPACGMTTSFSHFVRGQIPASVQANAAGTLLALVCTLLAPWLLWSAWRGYPAGIREPIAAFAWGLAVLAGITLLHWVVRLSLDGT